MSDGVLLDNNDLMTMVENKNINILYITFAIIIGLILLWIIIITITREDPVKILVEMNEMMKQIPAISDISMHS